MRLSDTHHSAKSRTPTNGLMQGVHMPQKLVVQDGFFGDLQDELARALVPGYTQLLDKKNSLQRENESLTGHNEELQSKIISVDEQIHTLHAWIEFYSSFRDQDDYSSLPEDEFDRKFQEKDPEHLKTGTTTRKEIDNKSLQKLKKTMYNVCEAKRRTIQALKREEMNLKSRIQTLNKEKSKLETRVHATQSGLFELLREKVINICDSELWSMEKEVRQSIAQGVGQTVSGVAQMSRREGKIEAFEELKKRIQNLKVTN